MIECHGDPRHKTHWRAVVLFAFALPLLLAPPAFASFGQVATFANSEEAQYRHVQTIAVNRTGAGGVPAGSVYVGKFRYDAKGMLQGEIGPAARTEFAWPQAVDQATGDLYAEVLHQRNGFVDPNEIQIGIYDATGSEHIASFGKHADFGQTIEETPELFHNLYPGAIAVTTSGVVYVADVQQNSGKGSASRIMVFEPETPGDYEHYVYTGRANDIVESSDGQGYEALHLALDDAGNLYTASEGDIYEWNPAEPDTPICEYEEPKHQLTSFTVDQTTGQPFYFSYGDKQIHHLSACTHGKFIEAASIPVTPKPQSFVEALAFNPNLAYEESRPPGILYAIDPSETTGGGRIFAPAKGGSAPVVKAESVVRVTSSTATLSAQIDPSGNATRYVFQYITEAAYDANEPGERFAGANEAPPGGGVFGEGNEVLSAGAALYGLEPETVYRFRVIATSHCEPEDEQAVCEAEGEARSFGTFPAEAPGLPDSRAYELVSPQQKSGGEVFPLNPTISSCDECKPGYGGDTFPRQSSPDGEAVVYEGYPFSYTDGSATFNEYLSRRTASGWQTTSLSPALMSSGSLGYKAFDARLGNGVLLQSEPALTSEAPSNYHNLYAQPTATPGTLTALLGAAPPNRSTSEFELFYAGASADFSRLFFAANDALTGATSFAPQALDGGRPNNNLYEWAEGELRLVNVLPTNAATVPGAFFGAKPVNQLNRQNSVSDLSHAISDDGSRVFWSNAAGQVYVRVNGESTIEIPDPAKFLTASADGLQVLLLDGHLYDLETDSSTDLTLGRGGFQGIVGQAEDLSRIYFVDTAVLTGEAENEFGDKAQEGTDNLYAWDNGSVSFVATLLGSDDDFIWGGGDWNFPPPQRTAQASPDGRWLAFLSRAPLTGYDSEGEEEVFVYSAASGGLLCASCGPLGLAPLGPSRLPLVPSEPAREDPIAPPRYMLDNGRLYFDSQNSLTPTDSNHGVEDVYQYEPQGVGSCKRASGCISLISAGREPVDSNFLAVDETGSNVFFTSRDQLVLKDRDDLIDLYDAREGGGIASETETSRGECQGEACQQPVMPPNDPTPGSSTFEGAGNVMRGNAKKRHRHAKKHKKRRRQGNGHKGHRHTKKRHKPVVEPRRGSK
jgi:hypothetical protein